MVYARRVWNKLYMRSAWGKRGTMNRRITLTATRVPVWWPIFTSCERWSHDWTWRDQKFEERGG